MKKENKIVMTCYLIASICYYISAILCFCTKQNTNTGVVHLCLGSTFLCLFLVYKKKDSNKSDK